MSSLDNKFLKYVRENNGFATNFFFHRKAGEEMRDEKRTLECLKKGARIASQCIDPSVRVQLYVELLNHYLFYFERGNSLITVAMLNQVR